MDDSLEDEYQALLQFLYMAPIGLIQAKVDGEIVMINPLCAQLLMPLSRNGDLSNLFLVLQRVAPELPQLARSAAYPSGDVCDGLRLPMRELVAGEDVAPTLSLRMVRMHEDQFMCSVVDVTANVKLEQQQRMATLRDAVRVDSLTGLPNRAVVLENIVQALRQAQESPPQAFVVLFINADRFSHVNVKLGQAAGDALLRLMAERLRSKLRLRSQRAQRGSGRPSRSTLARLGGDEFAIVLDGVRPADAGATAQAVASRLMATLNRPYAIQGQSVYCTVSVGMVAGIDLTEVPAGIDSAGPEALASLAESTLQHASLAMREAKRQGGARSQLFEPAIQQRASERAWLESELRQAISGNQLFVVYQPIQYLGSGRLAGVEALVRWQHPVRGLVSPLEFIAIAEESGLIVPLGEYVLSQACRQLAAWAQQLGSQAPPCVSVNLSRAQITEPSLIGCVQQALNVSGLAASRLQLEITESMAAENPLIQQHLHELKALGVSLALDDFGTGYSSLASLHLWPVDVIKIDRSFVSQVATSAHHRVLVEATVKVAQSLGMRTVAEGVETAQQAAVLTELGCDKAQGYLYARPLEAGAAGRWLEQAAAANTR